MLFREAYETAYGVFDHVNGDTSPPGWGLFYFNPKENYVEHGQLYNLIRRYHYNQVNKGFGLSLAEFMRLPKDKTDLILRILSEDNEREAALKGSIAKKSLEEL